MGLSVIPVLRLHAIRFPKATTMLAKTYRRIGMRI